MRLGFYLFLILCLTGCAGTKSGRNAMVITKATSQFYAGGVEGSPSGNQYWIHLQLPEGVVVDTVWVRNLPFEITGDNIRTTEGETVIAFRSANYFNDMTGETILDPTPSEHQPEYRGEALIIYHIGGVRRLAEVDSFERLEPAMHP